MNDRFNFTLQKEIFSRIVVDTTYFLNIGHNKPYNRQLNLLDPRIGYEHGSALNQRVDNPFFGLPQEIVPGPLANTRQVRVSDLLRPYPQYLANRSTSGNEIGEAGTGQTTGVTQLGVGARNDRYQAFQLQVQRPFANGFNFLIGYNYHRGINDVFYDAVDEVDNRFTEQRDAAGRSKFTFAGIYELPFGKGRKFGGAWNKALDGVLGGWSTSAIYQYVAGDFLRFGGLQVSGDPTLGNPNREQMFDTSAFSNLPAFTRRSNPWFYDGVHGPRFANLDMTLNKKIDISEKLALEIRLEAYNLSNSFMGNNPSTDVNNGNFGRISSQRGSHTGREFQYSARFIW